MARAIFPYRPAEPSSPGGQYSHGKVFRPLVTGTVIASNGESMRWLMLADSGADACVFPLSLATALKLDPKFLRKAMTGGVGNDANVTFYDTVTIDLGFGIIFTCEVGFTEGLESAGFGLLGQAGFFENYDVTFAHRRSVFTIERL